MTWKWLKNVDQAVMDAAKFFSTPQMYIADKPLENTAITVAANIPLRQRQQEMQLTQLKLQYIQQKEKQFQTQQAKLNHERAKELQEFIQRAEDAKQQKNLDFQQWCWQQEKTLQVELLELNQEFHKELANSQRQTSLKVVEEQKRLENSPIWLVAADILKSSTEDDRMPMRVFFAPPKLQFERFACAANAAIGFPDIELTLAEGLRQFFRKYSTQGRPLDFLAGAWVSKSFHSEASIKALFGVLKSEPTLVLESEIDGDYLNFRVAYWSLNWSKYRYDPVISRLPYKDILYESAKARACKWQQTRAKLIAAGEKPEEVDKLYGQDNINNLSILQREEKFRQAGIDTSELELNYIVSKKDFEELCHFLIIYHCLFAGLIADEYFLLEYNLPPLLPQLLPDLTQNVPDTKAVQQLIAAVVLYYQNVYEVLESQRSALVPELSLDLAQSFAHLPNKAWAKGAIVNSLKSWLKLHNLSQPEEIEPLLEALESGLTIADVEYVQKLNTSLAAIGKNRTLCVINACYKRGMSRCQQGKYQAAISDFDQAIKMHPQSEEAYYNRGLAYFKLGHYEKATEDYTQTLRINPDSAVVYCHRGYAYYKLGEHEQAMADCDRALSINPHLTQAVSNREIIHAAQDELKRKQQQEEERKRKLESLSLAYSLTKHSHTVRCLAISPDGQTLVSGSRDETIKIWELSTGQELCSLTQHSGIVYSLAISPDGQTLASCGWDHTIKIWELSTGKLLHTLTADTHDMNCVAISPDGQILVSGTDNTIKIWQLSTGEQLRTFTGHFDYVNTLVFTPDGQKLISGSADETIKVWHLGTGEELCTLKGHCGTVLCLAISPDGQTLVSGSADQTIKIWQLNTKQELSTLTAHSSYVNSLALGPDGQTLISGSADKTIKIWELSQAKELSTLTGHSGSVLSLAISPDGQTLVSGSADNTIKIWWM